MKMKKSMPEHVAIIMDGNGRWAKKRNMPRSYGHLQGIKRVDEVITAADREGVKVLTLFAFSTENWQRPKKEVSLLMKALSTNLTKKIDKLKKENIKFQVLGRKEGVPPSILKVLNSAQEKTKQNTGLILNLAFNYGSRQEIVDAVKDIAGEVKSGKVRVSQIDIDLISSKLYTSGMPDPDLLIRTSNEKRISNFLLWQLSYAEFYFTLKHWPDFTEKEFKKAIDDFKFRDRRYGGVGRMKGSKKL